MISNQSCLSDHNMMRRDRIPDQFRSISLYGKNGPLRMFLMLAALCSQKFYVNVCLELSVSVCARVLVL